MQNLGINRFGKHPSYSTKKRKRSKEELSWTKKSIFYELPYWKHLKIIHKIDVMHVEKNICDNIVGTMLGIDGKNKDTEKARLDFEDMNIRKELHLRPKGDKFEKPPACYTLKPEQRRDFCKFLKSVKFPDGYAANISRCANIADGKIHGLKSHDCHILLQRLLHVGIRAYLRKDVCTSIIDLCNFFHDLCAKTLTVSHLDKLEKDIVLILCKLERIFPPAFFDVMVHLAVHLPREAKLVGPVGYSWMYPIERYLGTLKLYVGNKARPEGSIAEAYIINECLTFISMHFTETESKFNRKERNDDELDGSLRHQGTIFVFAQKVCPTGATEIKSLSPEERDQIHWYILNNCKEVQPYMKEHFKKLKEETNNDKLLSQRQQKEFPVWFKNRMFDLRSINSPEATDELYSLALGFELRANSYLSCNLNGVRYHTKQREARRTTQNSGLVVDSVFEGKEIEFYGTLCDVIEVKYLNNYRVVLFKCDWFDLTPRKKNLKTDYDLTCLNVSSTWYQKDPYVIASDARQVFYLDDHKFGADWKVVLKMHHRHIWDFLEMDDDADEEEEEDVYQQTGDVTVSSVIQEDNNVGLDELHRDDVEVELVDAEIVCAVDIDEDDVDVEEEDDTLVDYNDSEVDEEDNEPVDNDTDLED
ncbi:uncharacterized protein LOC113288780 [Papaver somniferum]|uniref:uncharacterized protein LOC113288780 n=1 Tax=Papaver somniferum TaxID=3469 RepID=UPI000E702B4E|nr:uncharacterized protein LOC113288780 [Papaver somniferum]XP_026393684.1 uncharacterized protein LOC113288780 [Papaver somniferum]